MSRSAADCTHYDLRRCHASSVSQLFTLRSTVSLVKSSRRGAGSRSLRRVHYKGAAPTQPLTTLLPSASSSLALTSGILARSSSYGHRLHAIHTRHRSMVTGELRSSRAALYAICCCLSRLLPLLSNHSPISDDSAHDSVYTRHALLRLDILKLRSLQPSDGRLSIATNVRSLTAALACRTRSR